MYGEEKFLHDVGLLIDAYKSGILEHSDCKHCAAGIILQRGYWHEIFGTFVTDKEDIEEQLEDLEDFENLKIIGDILYDPELVLVQGYQNSTSSFEEFEKHVNSKGYTFNEIRAIEFAFESVLLHDVDKDGKFGVINTIKELGKIHWIDEELIQDQINKL